MKIQLSTFCILSGVALVISGFAYDLSFAGLPYQDPTPEMQKIWLLHKRIADVIIITGTAFFVLGFVWSISRMIMRLSRNHH